MGTGECASCGRGEEDLHAVHRVWVLPEVRRSDLVEWWCAACCMQFPHEPA